MKQLVTAAQMKYLDDHTMTDHRMDCLVLMERAALAVLKYMKKCRLRRTLVVCGHGNNGGDGIAIARLLYLAGKKVDICFAGNPDKMSEGCARQWEIARSYGVRWVNNPDYSEYTTIVDALFGVGLSRNITGVYAEVVQKINQSGADVIAVDIPSGICADDGRILGCAVEADITVTFAYEKVGQLIQPGRQYCGKLYAEDIGICQFHEIPGREYFALTSDDLDQIPVRPVSGNKGTFGKVLLIAGCPDMPGASVLCGRAAMRTGIGMLKMVIPKENREIIAGNIPEAMLAVYDSIETAQKQIEQGLKWADVVIIGPGLGKSQIAVHMVEYVIDTCHLPLVIDADALNILSEHQDWMQKITCPCIMTPHVGEMARLLGETIPQVSNDLLHQVQRFTSKYQVQCILKDSATIISIPDSSTYINQTGNCGMATAGSGDVLTGIVGALLSLGTSWEYAGALGVWIHGRLGDICKEKTGEAYLMAADLIEALPLLYIGQERG